MNELLSKISNPTNLFGSLTTTIQICVSSNFWLYKNVGGRKKFPRLASLEFSEPKASSRKALFLRHKLVDLSLFACEFLIHIIHNVRVGEKLRLRGLISVSLEKFWDTSGKSAQFLLQKMSRIYQAKIIPKIQFNFFELKRFWFHWKLEDFQWAKNLSEQIKYLFHISFEKKKKNNCKKKCLCSSKSQQLDDSTCKSQANVSQCSLFVAAVIRDVMQMQQTLFIDVNVWVRVFAYLVRRGLWLARAKNSEYRERSRLGGTPPKKSKKNWDVKEKEKIVGRCVQGAA